MQCRGADALARGTADLEALLAGVDGAVLVVYDDGRECVRRAVQRELNGRAGRRE